MADEWSPGFLLLGRLGAIPPTRQIIALSLSPLPFHQLEFFSVDSPPPTKGSSRPPLTFFRSLFLAANTWSGESQGQQTSLAPSANKQTRNYDKEYSNHHPSQSTLRPKGLSRSKSNVASRTQMSKRCFKNDF